ncbi:cytokine receptor family member b1 isoform X2 [Brachyhypopomus gauderio]|uniref:cytokine receptor family member b1 isoform X2 n=1 Tax=Brachyhypopomus gauderio TaxID=698409 RepID=UPI004041802C
MNSSKRECGSLSFPAPSNATLVSNNFQHILRWSPGRDTPPQTSYSVKLRKGRLEKLIAEGLPPRNHAIDVSRQMNDIYALYNFQLRASLGNRSSVVNVTPSGFCPFETTTIGPPSVGVLGCGNCLNITILLPKGQGIKKNDSVIIYNNIRFDLHWKKAQDEKDVQVMSPFLPSPNLNATHAEFVYVLKDLQPQQEYCVKVQPKMTANNNTLSSGWTCAFTSTVQPRGAWAYLFSWCTVSVLVGICALFTIPSLAYTGMLCKLKVTLPKALTDLPRANYASLEVVSFSVAEYDCSVRMNKSKFLLQPVEGDTRQSDKDSQGDEDEEDEDNNMENHCCYMERVTDMRDSCNINNVQSSVSTTIFPSEPAKTSGGYNLERVHQPQLQALKKDKRMSLPNSEGQDKEMSLPNSEGQDKEMSLPNSEGQDKEMSLPNSEGQDKEMSLPNSEGQDKEMSLPNSEGQDKEMSLPNSEGQDKEMSLPNSEGQDKEMSLPNSEGQEPKPPKMKESEKERMKEETERHGLRNINLLSVTLTSLQVGPNMSEDTEICKPLLPVVLGDAHGDAPSLSNPPSRKPPLSALQTPADVDTLTGQKEFIVYSKARLDGLDQADENERCLQDDSSSEEDENSSGYIGR